MARRDRNTITTELEITTPRQLFWALQQLAEGTMTIRLLSEVRADALRTFPTGAPKATIPVSELHRVLDDMMDSLADKTDGIVDGTAPTLTLAEVKTRIREFMPRNNQQLIDEEKFRDWWGLLIDSLQDILSNKTSSFVPSLATTLTNVGTRFADNGSGAISPADLHQTILDVTFAVEDLVDGGVIVTAPPTVTLTSPSNNATVPVGALTLTWTSTDATSFDVYWGPVGAAVLVADDIVTQSVGVTAVEGRADEWRVEATGPGGTVTSKTCNFTGQPGPTVNLSTPADAATGLTNPVTLTWTASNANLFDVTAGETGSEATVFTDIPNQPAQLSGLTLGVEHRWKVKAKGLQGAADVETAFRTFTTEAAATFPPTPMGFASGVTGARGVVEPDIALITSLADSGPGTFREAVHNRSNVVVVPMIGGTTYLESRVDASGSNITFLGHAAPGQGYAIASVLTNANDIQGLISITGSNQIWRHLRGRFTDTLANGRQAEGNNGNGIFEWLDSDNIWIDHCSGSYGTDGSLVNIGAYGSGITDSTISNCMMYYPIFIDRKNMLVDGFVELSIYKNLFCAGQDRQPVINGRNLGHVVEVIGNAMVDNGRGIDVNGFNAAHIGKVNICGNVRLINTSYPGFGGGNFEGAMITTGGTHASIQEIYVEGNIDNLNRTAQAQADTLSVKAASQAQMVVSPHAGSALTTNRATTIAEVGDDPVGYLTTLLDTIGCRSGGTLDSLCAAVKSQAINRTGQLLGGTSGGKPKISDPPQVGGIPTLTSGSPIVTQKANWNQVGAGGFLNVELEVQAVRNV